VLSCQEVAGGLFGPTKLQRAAAAALLNDYARCSMTDRRPVSDPLRTPVGRDGPVPQSDGLPDMPCHARDPPLLPTCITLRRRSPAKLPDLMARSARVDDMRHSAAKGIEGAFHLLGEGEDPTG
jgi:hypothetical protein